MSDININNHGVPGQQQQILADFAENPTLEQATTPSQYPDPESAPPLRAIELPAVPESTPPPPAPASPFALPADVVLSQSSIFNFLSEMAVNPPAPPPVPMGPPLDPRPMVLPPQARPAVRLPPAVQPLQPNPTTAAKVAQLAHYSNPHYTTYPLNPRFTPAFTARSYPVAPHRPPILCPNHPVFVYFGRDLSSPASALPSDHYGRQLFRRRDDSDVSDEGYGPGVTVHADVLVEAARAEAECVKTVVEWDAGRG